MYILIVNFHEGLKCLNPCRLAIKSSSRDVIQVSYAYSVYRNILQKHATVEWAG